MAAREGRSGLGAETGGWLGELAEEGAEPLMQSEGQTDAGQEKPGLGVDLKALAFLPHVAPPSQPPHHLQHLRQR